MRYLPILLKQLQFVMTFSGSPDSTHRPGATYESVWAERLSTLTGIVRSYNWSQYALETGLYLAQHWQLIQDIAPLIQEQFPKTGTLQGISEHLAQCFQENQLWQVIGAEVWMNVLIWSVQDLDTSTAISVIESLVEEEWREDIWQALFYTADEGETLGLLQELYQAIVQDLSQQVQTTLTAADNFSDWLKKVSSLKLVVPSLDLTAPKLTTPRFETNTVRPVGEYPLATDTATFLPTTDEVPLRLEHYLSRSEDYGQFLWELLAQMQGRCGLGMVQLQILLTAHAMRQDVPLHDIFTLNTNDILFQLDWQLQPQDSNTPQLFPLLRQLSRMVITSTLLTETNRTQVEALQFSGHPWDILKDSRGSFDWNCGRIAEPDEVYISLRPGLWIYQLTHHGNSEARQAFQDFGHLALVLLTQDYCRNPLLLGVLVLLMRQLSTNRDQIKTYTVQQLLDAALPGTLSPALWEQPDTAQTFFNAWNQALDALFKLGWRPAGSQTLEDYPDLNAAAFYQSPYPDWLNFRTRRKPQDWISQWLTQTVQLLPPLTNPQPFLTGDIEDTQFTEEGFTLSDTVPRRLRFDRLTGAQVRAARKAKRYTQAQLADVLNVHQSLIAKIESGNRSLSDDLERSLRQVLEL